MRKHINSNSKCNEIRMLLNKKKFKEKTFILLEGKTDIKLFRKLFNNTKVQLESVDGKDNVETIVKAVIQENNDRILGISDADFDHVNKSPSQLSIYLTDTHDTETLIIKEIGVDSIIAEFATCDYHDGLTRNLLIKALHISYEIGLLKLVNCRLKYNLSFEEIDLNRFLTINNLQVEFNQSNFIDEVIHRNKHIKPSLYSELLENIEKLRKDKLCEYMICSGHDITEVISLIMSQSKLCINTPISPSDVESNLRISFSFNDFMKTGLYQCLSDWSLTHQKVLFN